MIRVDLNNVKSFLPENWYAGETDGLARGHQWLQTQPV